MDLRSSLNLPDPEHSIPMKADLAQTEPAIQASWDAAGLYHQIQHSKDGNPTFVLHDGPPYTNSPIHIGTALNKILKDFVVKSRTMMGYQAAYVPGFDNHGLPIEQAVAKVFQEKKIQPTVVELRKACREHAAKFIDVQTQQFKRLGVFGLWEKPYATMNFRFEASIIRVFKQLAEKGYVYKGLRPTLWSPTSRTALADTEIVYKDHTSKAIYVAFPLKHDHNGFSKGLPNFYTIIWTTTPWTIPANLAVAFNPNALYDVVAVGDRNYLIAHDLLEKVANQLGWEGYEVRFQELGISFEGSVFKHPIFDRDSIAVMADYVTMEDGTGVVHTAPGHGRDDFYTGQKYGLATVSVVDERGVLNAEAGEFAGVYYKDCDKVVVERLAEVGALLQAYDYHHSYPYAERDDLPVIFRATEQWFVGLDHDALRQHMLKEIPTISWVPASGEARITAMIANRPDWCISRQRPWGVGIPVFYGVPSGKPVLDAEAIEIVAKLIESEGSDAWFEKDASEILPEGFIHPETGETEFRKETDVLDVWFDSGSTSLAVLNGGVEPEWTQPWPADLYLEGSDQHRGWFNSSLILGTATRGQAPYRQVLTHGFVTDEKGLKMSKRLGNVVDPEKACETFGADVVRYWVASVDYENDVPCSDNLLKTFGDNYRSVRNALRFLLMNIADLPAAAIEGPLLPIDAWAVEQTELLVDDCVRAYTEYDFSAVVTGVHNFCRAQLSNFYLDVIKDRMYCDGTDWETRRSAQRACRLIFIHLVKLIAPILPHTAEEAWQKFLGRLGDGVGLTKEECARSIHMEVFAPPSHERLAEIEESSRQQAFAVLLQVRATVFAEFEKFKGTSGVKDSQDVIVKYSDTAEVLEHLAQFTNEELAIMLKVSWIELTAGDVSVQFEESPWQKCERSRLRRSDVEVVDGVALTARDRRVLGL